MRARSARPLVRRWDAASVANAMFAGTGHASRHMPRSCRGRKYATAVRMTSVPWAGSSPTVGKLVKRSTSRDSSFGALGAHTWSFDCPYPLSGPNACSLVCVYMCTHLHTYTFTHVYVDSQIHSLIHPFVHSSINQFIDACMCACAHAYSNTYIPTYLHAYIVHTSRPTHLYTYIPTRLYPYACTYIPAYINAYSHTCMNAYTFTCTYMQM